MLKKFTCIICPNSCDIEAEVNGKLIIDISGNMCPKGKEYVENEIENPLRNFATSVFVADGDAPLCSVRLTKPIPKSCIFDAVREIKKIRVSAPVKVGQILLENLLGSGADVIATRQINPIE